MMKKQLSEEEMDSPLLQSLHIVYIHKTRKYTDIYQEFCGEYQQVSFKVKRQRGRLKEKRVTNERL